MATVHFILSAKGGIGKSLTASLLSQFFTNSGMTVKGFDVDPSNHSFADFKQLNVEQVDIMSNLRIDAQKFDNLIEKILESDADHIIIDNGASSFISLNDYLSENDIFSLLEDAGHSIVLHTILVGGGAAHETVLGFKTIGEYRKNILTWQNEYFGRVELGGKKYDDWQITKELKNSILGTIIIAQKNQDTFGKDIENMLAQKSTFDEVLSGSAFNIVARQRIKIVRDEIFSQLATIDF